MKKNDQVTINKPGILNGQTGVITGIRYEVDLGPLGKFYVSNDEVIPKAKESSPQVTKQDEEPAKETKQAKPNKPHKEVKQKRAYNKKPKS